MNPEFVPIIAAIASSAAAMLGVGVFLWRVFAGMFTGMEARFDDRLDQMDGRFDDRLNQMDRRFDDRFAQIDSRFELMDRRFDDRLNQMGLRFDDRFGHMDSQFRQMFASLETRFESLDQKVDGLASDHHGLSRELSEFRGEMRGRLSMLVPPVADET